MHGTATRGVPRTISPIIEMSIKRGGCSVRVIKYLFQHKAALALVTVLLVVLAAVDLALPTINSDIVDVGIQQSGVSDPSVTELSPQTYQSVASQLSPEDAQFFQSCYDAQGQTYLLNQTGFDNRSRLNDIMAVPMIYAFNPQAQLGATDAIIAQQAIAAAIQEYQNLGYEMWDMQMSYLIEQGALMLVLAGFGLAVNVLVGFISSRTGAAIGRDLRNRLFTKVVQFSEAEVGRFSAASLITRGTNDIQLIQNVSIMLMRMVFYAPILAAGGVVMVMVTSPSLGWIILVAIAAVLVVVGVLFKIAMPKFRIMQQLVDRVNLVSREQLTGMAVIRAFGQESREEDRFDEASGALMKTQLFTNRVMTFLMPTMMLVMNLATVAIVWFGGVAVDQGSMQTGDLIAFITYAMVIIMGFLVLAMISMMLPRADVAAARIDEVLSCEPSIKDPVVEQDASLQATRQGAEIRFDQVCFAYDNTSENVLEGVSFTARPGTTLAIIGPTGSGKSTVLKLMERFYDPTSGRVLLDGRDIRTLSQTQLRQQISYVPQTAFLFSGTVADNVSFSDPGMDPSRIYQALQVAQAEGFVSEFDGGTQFELSQGGTNVSGGQRQRLAIARALAKDARVILFDDSFSALDYKTDAALRQALEKYCAHTTRVIVAQRIATVMNADEIVVLDEGRVVGQGTHRQLMESCPEYREIACSQLTEEELSQGGGQA